MQAFSAAGRVVDVKVPTDRETGRPRGFAFVELENDEVAQRSIALLNGKDLRGRPLRVNEAENRPPRVGGPPSRGGPLGRPSSRDSPPASLDAPSRNWGKRSAKRGGDWEADRRGGAKPGRRVEKRRGGHSRTDYENE